MIKATTSFWIIYGFPSLADRTFTLNCVRCIILYTISHLTLLCLRSLDHAQACPLPLSALLNSLCCITYTLPELVVFAPYTLNMQAITSIKGKKGQRKQHIGVVSQLKQVQLNVKVHTSPTLGMLACHTNQVWGMRGITCRSLLRPFWGSRSSEEKEWGRA